LRQEQKTTEKVGERNRKKLPGHTVMKNDNNLRNKSLQMEISGGGSIYLCGSSYQFGRFTFILQHNDSNRWLPPSQWLTDLLFLAVGTVHS
jgi:hypothetical protein